MVVKSRLPEVGTSIFSVMSKMALEHQAINLSQGFPDFPVSEKLIELIHQNMKDGHNQYAPMPGVPSLRKVIAEVITATYQRPTDFETEVTVTAGGTEAIFSTIAALIGSGDEVILFDPAYDCYDPAIRLNGGIPFHLNLKPPHFAIDWQEVQDKITPNTKMIMVNTPHNPSGAVLNESDMLALQKIALKHDLIVLSDEVYERIIFDGISHQSVLKYPDLAKRSIAVFSFGKTFHATGWKVGYTVASEELTREIRKTHQFITFSVNTPIQFALAEYLKESKNYMYLGKFYQQKRDFFLNHIKGSSLKPLPCFGSYFQLLSYEGVSTKSEMEMAAWMTKEKKLAPIPVSAFYKDGSDQKLLRFCFAKSDTTLESAGKILRMI
ncbi:MAG: aminotransferase class I/II-fold pyridoxal phosphate-dependent enzyme [Cytophagales bacterium]|nr:aminotransferase class I/II-fold pyridoxal phosphate-dependent enzyme [Cytophagales bacterium]MCA6365947.1 aminotransferase class I/II-fold pyridoxal phosphate-dependent enzyme [Cytophagales bacterium]MCA6373266.1 aminotransferase class I/II-fold pyridoxal phosphate-dependent enzyme [Cytophagales bacterium]MCA6374890.1 aminotransferase class I/II-fold pyridoxal phosphate-dependent enzyme [Cytophagales bacterium]MCA6382802.1 aminotransferase class I/II-fold pyridoxal phosphate-dependent enzym